MDAASSCGKPAVKNYRVEIETIAGRRLVYLPSALSAMWSKASAEIAAAANSQR